MFSEHIKPNEVLSFVYDSLLSVLSRMMDLGFPSSLTPPHTASVYVVIDTHNPDKIGVGRSEPYLLSRHNKSDWSAIGLHNLDCSATERNIPIGCFLGMVMSETELASIVLEKNSKPSSDVSYFVGVLLSPCGYESVGCYAKLDDLENTIPFDDDPLGYTNFDFLNTLYTRIEDSDDTIH